jgi:hypothetical protein
MDLPVTSVVYRKCTCFGKVSEMSLLSLWGKSVSGMYVLNKYTYYSCFIPEGIVKASQTLLRDAYAIP